MRLWKRLWTIYGSVAVRTSLRATATGGTNSMRLGECGGDCAAKPTDADGICDDEDDCVGDYDACGVCNGPGETLRVRMFRHPRRRLRL